MAASSHQDNVNNATNNANQQQGNNNNNESDDEGDFGEEGSDDESSTEWNLSKYLMQKIVFISLDLILVMLILESTF